MNMIHFRRFLLAALLVLTTVGVRADEEQDLIATLQSNAGPPRKCAACVRLRVIGTTNCVPALAALLVQEETAHAARYALEGLPFPEALAALRQALPQTTGAIRAGLIDSLGWRQDAASGPLLVPLLNDADPVTAAAAASALGRIGGKKAIAALVAARQKAAPEVRPAVWNSLLQVAEARLANGDTRGAIALYRGLCTTKFPDTIRVAAWRGLVLAQPRQRADLVRKALAGTDRPLQVAACKALRELNSPALAGACQRGWTSLPVEAQLAVLDAQSILGAEALPLLRAAIQSPHLTIRIAAWQALGDCGDASVLSDLAKAAASGEPGEQDAAREALTRLRGPGVREALLSQLASAEPPERIELLRALGDRDDEGAADLLLKNAGAGPEVVRLAALESLRKLAVPHTAIPLLALAAKSSSQAESEAALKALYVVCRESRDKDQLTRKCLEAMNQFAEAQRIVVLPVLAELGTTAALEAAQSSTRDPNPENAKAAVAVLAQWPNAAAAPSLLELARSETNSTLQVLAVRGCIQVADQEPDLSKRLALLQGAMAAAKRPEEKKQALGRLGQIPTTAALQEAMDNLSTADLVEEAALAAVSIAEKLVKSNPELAAEVGTKVMAQCKNPEIVRRAEVLTGKAPNAAHIKVSPGPFIQDWLVCGPYRQAGVSGALAVFAIPFGPEKEGERVTWKRAPRGEVIDLGELFPGEMDCVAYLKTWITVPRNRIGTLLLGSDDGVKAWLNGEVVFGNNIDRGLVKDEDQARIRLRQGTNELMLKITQGGGGWAACARIVGASGKPIQGLRARVPDGVASAAMVRPASTPAPEPTPAALPPRDAFQKIRLSDQFYAEGANCGDFNRDGKMDIVAGPFWFEGPDFQKRHEYRPAKAYDPKEYSDNFLTFVGDLNGDGWPDVLCVPFPGKEAYWYENPAGKEGHWQQHLAYTNVGNESPAWGDINGDGRPELVFCNEGYLGYAGPDPARLDQPWIFHPISEKNSRYQRFTHGLGLGDINGDKRVDIVEAAGWWEQPADLKPGQPWIFHPFHFADAGAQMLVYDVDGDGLADIITAWHCHEYGLVWWQQIRNGSGAPDWKKHVILSPTPDLTSSDFRVSEMHALALADMNGDGLMDIVTGKRFWAHGPSGDKEPNAPAILFWYELKRDGQGGASFVPHLIDDDSGVGTQVVAADVNNDGRPDVIVANKKGIFVHLNHPAK